MRASELLAQARRLARASSKRPRQVDLKRAVSATYYAQFHALAKLCADTVAGTGRTRSTGAWRQTYRALAHGPAKNACSQANKKGFPQEIVRFADLFVSTQQERHSADYDPLSSYRRGDVLTMNEAAERSIQDLAETDRTDLRAFVALVLLPERPR